MNFIVENAPIIIGIAAVLIVGITLIIRFFVSSRASQINKIMEWLLYATTLAEKELGAGTGKLKLRYVYDMFVVKFPWMAKVIRFEQFSIWVDEALKEMNRLLTKNNAVQLYVNGPSDCINTTAKG